MTKRDELEALAATYERRVAFLPSTLRIAEMAKAKAAALRARAAGEG